jgi:hypothetical protein
MALMLAELIRKGSRLWRGVLAALLGFAAAGMNEVTVPVLLLVLGVGLGYALRRRRCDAVLWLAALVAAGAGTLLVLASPGNVSYWIFDFAFIGATALLTWWLAREHRHRPLPRPSGQTLAAATFALFAVPFALFLLVPWTLGWDAPRRVIEHIHLLFLGGWAACTVLWTAGALHKPAPRWLQRMGAMRRALPWVFAVTATAGLWLGEGTRWALFDLYKGRAARFDRQMRARYAQLHAAREAGEKHVIIERLDDPPVSLLYYDLSAMKDDLYNKAWATMFGLETVAYPPEEKTP